MSYSQVTRENQWKTCEYGAYKYQVKIQLYCKSPGSQDVLIFQVSLYNKATPFGATTKCVVYAGVSIFKCPD